MRVRRFATAVATVAAVTVPMTFGTLGVAAAAPTIKATTITYNLSGAPDYASAIQEGISHWNSALHNVKFAQTSGQAMLTYHQGDYGQEGSYYSGNSHGNGDIYIDNAQAQQYDHTRITAHETGHDLGLPDDCQGPCSELMSGGGPGPSCTNSYPNSDEVAQADADFANGLNDSVQRRTVVVRGY